MRQLPSMSEQIARQAAVYRIVDQRIKDRIIAPRVSEAIIEEHRRRPLGMHSDELERVLIYLRRHGLQLAGKLIIVCTRPHEEWRIAELAQDPHRPPVMRPEIYTDRLHAEHGVFLLRLTAAGLLPAGHTS